MSAAKTFFYGLLLVTSYFGRQCITTTIKPMEEMTSLEFICK